MHAHSIIIFLATLYFIIDNDFLNNKCFIYALLCTHFKKVKMYERIICTNAKLISVSMRKGILTFPPPVTPSLATSNKMTICINSAIVFSVPLICSLF